MFLRRIGIALLSAAALAAAGLASPAAAGAAVGQVDRGAVPSAVATTPNGCTTHPLTPRVLVTFPTGDWGEFAEGMVMARDGTIYVSVTTWVGEGWNRGQIWTISPRGVVSKFGPELDVGFLSGLALDDHGRLYAGLYTWDDPNYLPGVLRVDRHSATRVLTLAGGAFGEASLPNGLAWRDGYLYVSDSTHGAIWRTRPHGSVNDVPSTPWYQAAVLAPSRDVFGINGIVVERSAIYAAVSDTGLIVRIPLDRHGRPGPARVVATDPALVTVDGLTRGPDGALWATVNYLNGKTAGGIVRIAAHGAVSIVADGPSWLAYPAQPMFGATPRTRTTLYVANGGLDVPGTANVLALRHVLPHGR